VKAVATYALDGYTTVTLESAEVEIAPAAFVTIAAPAKTVVGSVITSNLGEWIPADGEVAYQWYRGATAIGGATAATYTVVAADASQPLKLKVTVTAPGYAAAEAEKVAITGTANVGKTLTAKLTGTWAPTAKPTLSYQWLRAGKAIAGATKATYKLVAADAGKAITVRVTATAPNTVDATVTSAAVKAMNVFTKSATPKITGTAKVGKTLKVTTGTWSPKPTFTYQWYRGTTAIKGATKASYKLVAADKGKKIKVVVTAKAKDTVTVTKTSAATKAVAKK